MTIWVLLVDGEAVDGSNDVSYLIGRDSAWSSYGEWVYDNLNRRYTNSKYVVQEVYMVIR